MRREIGEVLRQRDGDCWSSRAVVGVAGKTVVALRALHDLRDLRDLRDLGDSGDSADLLVSDKSIEVSRSACGSAMEMSMAMAMATATGTLNRQCSAVSFGERPLRREHAN